MSPTKQKGHTTLSDLLADDVRDYFVREGVESETPSPHRRRSAAVSRKKKMQNSKRMNQSAAAILSPNANATSSESPISPLRAGWANANNNNDDNDNAPSDILPSSKNELGNSAQMQKSLGDNNNKETQNYHHQSNLHQQQQSNLQGQGQFHGQNTAERHSAVNYSSSNSASYTSSINSRPNNLQQEHRRHSSGSSSFHSHHSRGSASSRGRHVSAVDAEFLRRYTEEKERTNRRMSAAQPWASHNNPDAIAPADPIGANVDKQTYHSITQSSRPPTVTGSHRPGLPSIDNDDWEENDRIERRDQRKQDRRLSRKLERHRRMDSGAPSSTGTSSPKSRSGRRTNSHGGGIIRSASGHTLGSHGESSVVYHGQPLYDMSRSMTNRSIMSNGSIGLTPGTNTSMSYSADSTLHGLAQPPDLPFNNNHQRGNSMGSFVRQLGSGQQRQSYPQQAETTQNSTTRHVRPLSYLSASSDSGDGKSGGEPSREGSYPVIKEDSTLSSPPSHLLGMRPSPHSSSSGTYNRYPLIPGELSNRFSSTDRSSDLNSSLLGSAIMDSTVSDSSRLSRVNDNNYQRRYDDESSSDGSYDSDSESSYTSDSYDGDSSSHSQSSSEYQYRQQRNMRMSRKDIEQGKQFNERDKLFANRNGGSNYSSIETTKARNKKNRYKPTPEKSRLSGPNGVPLRLDDAIDVLFGKLNSVFIVLELLISNMPSMVGSLALAWASMGVDWFKWYEETFSACHPAHYHSKLCVFTEFPGCFACETDADGYQFFVHFHYLCSTIAFILSSFLLGKILIAFPVVRDELANPTTAAPLGLLFMAFMKVFAGNFGSVGEGITFVAAGLHTIVAAWFIFISVVYKTLPEPSWFANTTGIGLAAAKIYLYWTPGGYFLSFFSLILFMMFYVVSLYRIHTNDKISAPVCWVQLSGPAVVLYGFTIFSQPGSDVGNAALMLKENYDHFDYIHRKYYMPVLHVMFAFCMVSMVSSLYLLRIKWKSFRTKEFSPAHVSFCAPMVAHCNAMQAYRSSLQKFSTSPRGTTFELILYRYWTFSLICGTVLVFVMSTKFFMYLPGWCQINVENDEMPPEPEETIVTRLLEGGKAGDAMKQNFVSAAVLQANESGALVRVLQDGRMKYVRSRRMPSMGFDPIMNVSELMSERERLLQHVTYKANPNRPRLNSFNDAVTESFRISDGSSGSFDRLGSSLVSTSRHRNVFSFDASAMMRGDHD